MAWSPNFSVLQIASYNIGEGWEVIYSICKNLYLDIKGLVMMVAQ